MTKHQDDIQNTDIWEIKGYMAWCYQYGAKMESVQIYFNFYFILKQM